MPQPESAPAPIPPRTAAAALSRMAPWLQAALVLLGLVVAGNALRDLDPRRAPAAAVTALVHLGGFVLAGWVARRLLAAQAAALDLLASGSEAAARLAEAAARLATALEHPPRPELPHPYSPPIPPAPPPAAADSRTVRLAEIHVALRQGEWLQAETLIQTFTDRHPSDDEAAALRAQLQTAKDAAVSAHRARLEAAREANDSERVLELRDALALLLDPDALDALDRSLARWFMARIQKRLRQGKISLDVVVLAARVASTLDTTAEGASLRAALPTLRRSVGLCPRCGQPYTGIMDACPACLAAGALAVPVPPTEPASNGEVEETPGETGSQAIALEPD